MVFLIYDFYPIKSIIIDVKEKKIKKLSMSRQDIISHLLNVQGACNTTLCKLQEIHCDDLILVSDIDFIISSIAFLVDFITKSL